MPNAPLRPETAALLLIDHQVGTAQLVRTQPAQDSIRFAAVLARTATILGMPVIVTSSQEDRIQGPIAPQVQVAAPEAFAARIKREGTVNAWTHAGFRAAVEATGRRQLIMAGLTTDVCLVFPAIDAAREGFQTYAVLDASGSPFQTSEDLARQRMASNGVVLTATNTLMAELAQDWSSPLGGQLIQLMLQKILPPMEGLSA